MAKLRCFGCDWGYSCDYEAVPKVVLKHLEECEGPVVVDSWSEPGHKVKEVYIFDKRNKSWTGSGSVRYPSLRELKRWAGEEEQPRCKKCIPGLILQALAKVDDSPFLQLEEASVKKTETPIGGGFPAREYYEGRAGDLFWIFKIDPNTSLSCIDPDSPEEYCSCSGAKTRYLWLRWRKNIVASSEWMSAPCGEWVKIYL